MKRRVSYGTKPSERPERDPLSCADKPSRQRRAHKRKSERKGKERSGWITPTVTIFLNPSERESQHDQKPIHNAVRSHRSCRVRSPDRSIVLGFKHDVALRHRETNTPLSRFSVSHHHRPSGRHPQNESREKATGRIDGTGRVFGTGVASKPSVRGYNSSRKRIADILLTKNQHGRFYSDRGSFQFCS